MVWQRARLALLCGVVMLAANVPAQAGDCCKPAPCCTRKVCCYEWVPEKYQCEVTVYKKECREEEYTAYKCICVPEKRTRCVTVYKKVPCYHTVKKKYCVCVPCVEERTVMKKVTVCKPYTKKIRKCVDKGHYECKCVPCKPGLCERLCKCFKKKDDCCCEPECPKFKTVKVWVPCPVWEEHCVTCMKKCTECVPTTCKVHRLQEGNPLQGMQGLHLQVRS